MNVLENKILEEGKVLEGNVLKVNTFLNHQVDIKLLEKMAEDSYEFFKEHEINKILTIEASGIAIGTVFAQKFDVPLVFAKTRKSSNTDLDSYEAEINSFTKKTVSTVYVSRLVLDENDKVLIVDDFLAEGNAVYGLLDIINQAKAEVVGINIAIEKGFQNGGKNLRADGYRLYSQAIIEKFEDGEVVLK